MEAYANVLLYAIPFFIGLVLLEIGYGHFVKNLSRIILGEKTVINQAFWSLSGFFTIHIGIT